MRIAMLVIVTLLAFSAPSNGQNKPETGFQKPLTDTEQIRTDRAKAGAREQNESKTRPWDRDANGKRPWDRKDAPTPED